MQILGADLPVVVLLLLALFCALWAWLDQMRQTRQVRRMVDWLKDHHGADWAALTWHARSLMPRAGIAEMTRRGLTDDPHFAALAAEARRLEHRCVKLIGSGIGAMVLLTLGFVFLGWDIG